MLKLQHQWLVHVSRLAWSKMRSSQGVLGVKGPTRPNVSQMGSVRPTCRKTQVWFPQNVERRLLCS